MRARRWLRGAVALAAVMPASACWVQQKGDNAARIIDAASKATQAGSTTGDMQLLVQVLKIQGQDIKRLAKLRQSQLAGAPGARSSSGAGSGAGATSGAGQAADPAGDALASVSGGSQDGQGGQGKGQAGSGAAAGGGGPAGGLGGAAAPDPTKEQSLPPLPMAIDLAHDRAALAILNRPRGDAPNPAGKAPQARFRPLALYFGWTIYRYTPPANEANGADNQQAATTDAATTPTTVAPPPAPAAAQPADGSDAVEADVPRVWLKLDFAKVNSNRKAELPGLTVFPSVPPTLLVRLLKGCLTGSVRVLGMEDVDGVRTTHYRFNIDRDKATQGMSEKFRRNAELVFERSGFQGSVFRNAEVWLDEQGRPRRLVVRVHQKVRSDLAIVGFSLNLKQFGQPVSIDQPISDATSTVADYPQLVSSRG